MPFGLSFPFSIGRPGGRRLSVAGQIARGTDPASCEDPTSQTVEQGLATVEAALSRFQLAADENRLLLFIDGSPDAVELGQFATDGSFSASKYGGALGNVILRYGADVTDGSGDLLQILDASIDGVLLMRISADGTISGKGLSADPAGVAQARADAAAAIAAANNALQRVQTGGKGQLMRDLAVRARSNNPAALPAMTTPPTITCAAGTDYASLGLPDLIPPNHTGAFAVFGGELIGAGTGYNLVGSVSIPGNGNVGQGKTGLAWAYEFWTDAPKFCFFMGADPTTCFFRAQVDGVYASKLFQQANAAGGSTLITFDFGGVRRPRLIRFEGGGNSGFAGLAVTKFDSVWAPTQGDVIRACWVGDSLIEGLAGKHSFDPGAGWAPATSTMLGWRNTRVAAIGGTGYLNPGPADGGHWKWGDHAADWLTWSPDVLLFAGTVNDTGYDAAAVAAEALRVWTQARAGLPGVPIIIVGLAVDPAYVGNVAAIENAMANAFAGWGDPSAYFIRIATDPDGPWIVGNGGDGVETQPTGIGNSDIYVGGGPHPNQLGDEYLAYRLAEKLRDIVTRF